jgi:hypothetical protein
MESFLIGLGIVAFMIVSAYLLATYQEKNKW